MERLSFFPHPNSFFLIGFFSSDVTFTLLVGTGYPSQTHKKNFSFLQILWHVRVSEIACSTD